MTTPATAALPAALAWSPWHRVADVFDSGWNLHEVPWKVGVYRFRVRPDHPLRPGEVVYVGRAATTKSSALCRRVGLFIVSAMGFYGQHSGGIRFYDESDEHGLSPKDLEYSWAEDDDPWCAEYEEYLSYGSVPVLNRKAPETCGAPGCHRHRALVRRLRVA